MPMDYEEDDFPMMAKRKMMKMMKAKKMGEDYPEMEKEMSLVKVEIKIGDSKEKKGKK